jgi:hypothetical protein
MEEVIRIEPRVPAAWATLALCYQDSMPEKALKLKIIRAHLVHDVDLWLSLGNESRYFSSSPCLSVLILGFFLLENLDISNKHFIAAAKHAPSTPRTSTPNGNELPSPRN